MMLLSYHKKPVQSETAPEAFERHYSVLELAEMWSLSERTIRRMFEGEEGVVNWARAAGRYQRHYRTLTVTFRKAVNSLQGTVWNFGAYGAKRDFASAIDPCEPRSPDLQFQISVRIFCLGIHLSAYFRTLRKH